MSDIISLRTENGKLFDAGKDAKTGRPSYTLEARTGPIHYKDAYRDTDPWLDLDESYCEPGELKGIGRVLVYPRLPNIVTVFQDRCGYQIQSRSNPDHVAKVELVSIDGLPVTNWQDSAALKTSVRVHPYRVGIWKDFSAASKARATTMRWKVTELGNADRDSHPFAFLETPEAYNTADLATLDPAAMEQAKVTIETARTRIDDISWYWDELIPAEAKLVDTDWQVGAGGDDGTWYGASHFYNKNPDATFGYATVTRHIYARLTSISIPSGSTIVSATLTVTSSLTRSTGTVLTRQRFVKATNPSAPASYNDINDATKTTAYSDKNWGALTKDQTYSDTGLVSAMQEIIDQGGWSSGNAVICCIIDNGSDGWREIYLYENSSSVAPKLTVTWTPPTRGPGIYVPNVSWLSKSLQKRREI